MRSDSVKPRDWSVASQAGGRSCRSGDTWRSCWYRQLPLPLHDIAYTHLGIQGPADVWIACFDLLALVRTFREDRIATSKA